MAQIALIYFIKCICSKWTQRAEKFWAHYFVHAGDRNKAQLPNPPGASPHDTGVAHTQRCQESGTETSTTNTNTRTRTAVDGWLSWLARWVPGRTYSRFSGAAFILSRSSGRSGGRAPVPGGTRSRVQLFICECRPGTLGSQLLAQSSNCNL